MKTISIRLAEPRTDIDGQTFDTVELREPRAHEVWSIGEIFTQVQRTDGSIVLIENVDAIRAYLDAIVTVPTEKAVINALCLRDALAVKDALMRFFVDARQAMSGGSATSSSSTPGSSTPTPAAS